MILFILGGVFMLALSIFVHELGHYLMGRFVGIKAEIFSIGYGRGIWKRKVGDTTFQITAIPLGGYVKFFGDDFADRKPVSGGLLSAHPLKRIVPVIGGPFFNLILAFIMYSLLHTFSGPLSTRVSIWEENREEMPAYKGGLRDGDVILSVNGAPVQDFYAVKQMIALSGGAAVRFEVERDGERQTFEVNPQVTPSGAAMIGIRPPGSRHLEVNYPIKDVWAYRFRSIFGNAEPSKTLRAMAYLNDGDVILTAEGQEVHSINGLQRILGEHHGQPVELKLRRQVLPWLTPWITKEVTVIAPTTGEYRLFLRNLKDVKYDALINDQQLTSNIPEHQRGLAFLSFDGDAAGSFERIAAKFDKPKEVQLKFRDREYTSTVVAEKVGFLGFKPSDRIEMEYAAPSGNAFEIFGGAFHDLYEGIMVYPEFFRKLFAGRLSFADNAMGPVGMFAVAGAVVKSGYQDYLQLLASISIALFVMNLLPFPVVDGGHIVIYLYEAISGKTASPAVLEAVYRFGFTVLMMFGLWVMYKDILFAFGF